MQSITQEHHTVACAGKRAPASVAAAAGIRLSLAAAAVAAAAATAELISPWWQLVQGNSV